MIRQLSEAEQAQRGTCANNLGPAVVETPRMADRKAKHAGKRKRKSERRERARMLRTKHRLRSIPSKPASAPSILPANRFGESGTFHATVGHAEQNGCDENGTSHDETRHAHPTAAHPTTDPQTGERATFHPPVGHTNSNDSANPAAPQAAAQPQPHLLADNQMVALMTLLRGESNSDAAQTAGVDRRTIYRWRQLPAFQAEMHRIQSSVAASLRHRAAGMAEESIKVISEKLNKTDLIAALGVLKATRILDGQPLTEIDEQTTGDQSDPATVFSPPAQGSSEGDRALPATATGETTNTAVSQPSRTHVDPADLLPPQQVAIAQLLSGKVAAEAAQEAGVTITMLARWMKSDAAFREVLATGRRQQLEALQTQLLNLSIRALDVLEYALKKLRDRHAAFAVLHGVGVVRK